MTKTVEFTGLGFKRERGKLLHLGATVAGPYAIVETTSGKLKEFEITALTVVNPRSQRDKAIREAREKRHPWYRPGFL